jgi:hypothetical protein
MLCPPNYRHKCEGPYAAYDSLNLKKYTLFTSLENVNGIDFFFMTMVVALLFHIMHNILIMTYIIGTKNT